MSGAIKETVVKIALLGPVGVGKGTQAQRLSRTLLNYTRISTGELVRNQIQAVTEIGVEIKGYHDRGEPVPDGIILDLTIPHLQPAGFYILDGFPRTLAQARALDIALGKRGGGLDHVVMLQSDDDEKLIQRVLGGRRQSLTTGRVHHLDHDPPPSAEQSMDPGPFEKRSDDTEEALRRQISAYHEEADSLKDYYEKQGILALVGSDAPMDEVTARIFEVLGDPQKPTSIAN